MSQVKPKKENDFQDYKAAMEKHAKENDILKQAQAIKDARGIEKKLVEGIFSVYYETGMEGTLGMCVQDRSKITPNPNYDEKDPSKGPKEFYSYDGLYFLEHGDMVIVKNPDKSIAYQGVLTKNKEAMSKMSYRYSFIPKEVELEVFLKWVNQELEVILFAERVK